MFIYLQKCYRGFVNVIFEFNCLNKETRKTLFLLVHSIGYCHMHSNSQITGVNYLWHQGCQQYPALLERVNNLEDTFQQFV